MSHVSRRRARASVIALCWLVVVSDGYDLIVYGSVLPVLEDERSWDLGARALSVIGALTFLGMLIGAIVMGRLSDRVGRRVPMLACTAWFSLCMIGCATAMSPQWLGATRFLAGLGLGGLFPIASALLMEYAPPRHRTFAYALAMSGIPLGGVLAALLSLPLLPEPGWRALFWIGALPLVIVVPLAWRYLPESMGYLVDRGRTEEASALADRYGLPLPAPNPDERPAATRDATEPASAGSGGTGLGGAGQVSAGPASAGPGGTGLGGAGQVGAGPGGGESLFRGADLVATLCLWAATFLALLTWYGLGTWLPGIMRDAGYALGSAGAALLVLSVGGVLGSWAMAGAGDRFGHRRVTVAAFLIVASALFLLSTPVNDVFLYLLLVVAGTGAVSCQVLINSFVAARFPAHRRGAALGWSLGVGRIGAIVGPLAVGAVIGAGLSYHWNFYLFGTCALVGALAIILVPPAEAEGAQGAMKAAEQAGKAASAVPLGGEVSVERG